MPIIQSAKKRVKVASKARARNIKTKANLRDAMKAYAKALEAGKTDKIASAQQAVLSAIDTATKKAVIHKNKAARSKAQVSKMAKATGFKPVKAAPKPKTPTKKPVAKKPVAKKKTAKK